MLWLSGAGATRFRPSLYNPPPAPAAVMPNSPSDIPAPRIPPSRTLQPLRPPSSCSSTSRYDASPSRPPLPLSSTNSASLAPRGISSSHFVGRSVFMKRTPKPLKAFAVA